MKTLVLNISSVNALGVEDSYLLVRTLRVNGFFCWMV